MERSKGVEKDKVNPTRCPALKITRRTAAEKGKAKASPTVCPDTPLDPDLWKMLPSELMHIVLSKIPFRSLMKFRAVCKDWKSVAVPTAARVGKVRGSTMLLCQPKDDGFNPCELVHLISLPCSSRMPRAQPAQTIESDHSPQTSQMFQPERSLQGLFPDHVLRHLVSSEGGLLFFASREVDENRTVWKKLLLVWNPLTQEHKILYIPSTLIDNHEHFVWRPHVGMVVNVETGNYKLLVAVDLDIPSKGNYATLLYDSSRDSWRRTQCLQESKTKWVFVRNVVCYKDGIYLELTSVLDPSSIDTFPFTEVNDVFKFDVHNEIWTKVGETTKPNDNFNFCFHRLSLTRENNQNPEINLITRFYGYRRGQVVSTRRELAHWVHLDPETFTYSKLRKTVRRFFLHHNPEAMTRDHGIWYFGFRQENSFYHVLHFQDVRFLDIEGELVVDADEIYGDVGVVVHELNEHSDTRLYLKQRLRNEMFYNFYAFSPSLAVLV